MCPCWDGGNFILLALPKANFKCESFRSSCLQLMRHSSSSRFLELLDDLSNACRRFGLTISLKKTMVLSFAAEHEFFHRWCTPWELWQMFEPGIHHGPQERSVRFGNAAVEFGKLEKKHLTINTKFRVYEACILNNLFYSAASWNTYIPQEDRLSIFRTRPLCCFVGVSSEFIENCITQRMWSTKWNCLKRMPNTLRGGQLIYILWVSHRWWDKYNGRGEISDEENRMLHSY